MPIAKWRLRRLWTRSIHSPTVSLSAALAGRRVSRSAGLSLWPKMIRPERCPRTPPCGQLSAPGCARGANRELAEVHRAAAVGVQNELIGELAAPRHGHRAADHPAEQPSRTAQRYRLPGAQVRDVTGPHPVRHPGVGKSPHQVSGNASVRIDLRAGRRESAGADHVHRSNSHRIVNSSTGRGSRQPFLFENRRMVEANSAVLGVFHSGDVARLLHRRSLCGAGIV